MTTDATAWLADQLSLTVLEDAPDGRVSTITGPAQGGSGTLEEALARLAGIDPRDELLRALLQRARRGARGSIVVTGAGGSVRIAAWPADAPGRARALAAGGASDSIARKAAAADLAAGVTHEVANSLTAIAGWARMASGNGPLPERTRQALDVVQRSARDALGTARGLLRTMRDAGRERVVANANENTNVPTVVTEVIDTLRPELEEAGIALELETVEEALGPMPPAALRLIVSNLVRNAFEALSRGGRVSVAVHHHGDRILLTVADDGPGMSASTLAQAFDRYFTTKTHGTGLGLALVRDTVHEIGGRVEVESRRGSGTRFDIWLPAIGAPALTTRPPQVTGTTSGVHPKPSMETRAVLVVDDDEAMRSLIRTALELSGAMVTTAATPEEALACAGPFTVALVDLALGVHRGDELLVQLRENGIVERAILLTGSTSPELDPRAAPDALLYKPFELDDLARTIDSVLDATTLSAEEA